MTLFTTSLGWTTPDAMPSRKRAMARSICETKPVVRRRLFS
jgi:hypothetical protein